LVKNKNFILDISLIVSVVCAPKYSILVLQDWLCQRSNAIEGVDKARTNSLKFI